MNLDLAIQNTLRRGSMENALHGVMSNFGASYQLNAYPETIKKVEEMFGISLGSLSPNVLSRPSIAPVVKQAEVQNLSETIGVYNVSYDVAKNNWTLSETIHINQNWLTKLLRLNNSREKILITKYGANSGHRFLSALESRGNIQHDAKNRIAAVVVTHMNQAGSITNLQQGYSVDVQPSDDTIQIRGTAPFAAERFNSPIEMGLAPTYAGVTKQTNSTFMGDTLIPSPLTTAQLGTLRTEIGNPVGLHIAPPTKMYEPPRRMNRSI